MNIHAIEEIKDVAADSRPVLAIRLGRGRTGGSTFLDFLVQRTRRKGKEIRVADGDRITRRFRNGIRQENREARCAREARKSATSPNG